MIDLDKDTGSKLHGVVFVFKGVDRGGPPADVGIGVKDGDLDWGVVTGGLDELVQKVGSGRAAGAGADDGYLLDLGFGMGIMRVGMAERTLDLICERDDGQA